MCPWRSGRAVFLPHPLTEESKNAGSAHPQDVVRTPGVSLLFESLFVHMR